MIFACDSFLPGDFIFQGRLKPHSIRGTKGAEVIDQLDRGQGDMILEKRRFSAFFKTDLDQTLRTFGVDTVVVAGISTQVCVLTTVLDAVALDFKAILLKDCCAAHTPEIHDTVLRIYGNDFMAPIMRAMSCDKFITEML